MNNQQTVRKQIPNTFLEALSLATILSIVLGYEASHLAIAIDGDELHVGVPDEKIHFLAGTLPTECVGGSREETTGLTAQEWKKHVEAFNQLEPTARIRLILASAAYRRRTDIASEFVSRGVTPPRLLS
jgi:hypothetical protein